MYQFRDAGLQFSDLYNTKWRTPLDSNSVDCIVIHHPDADWTVQQTHDYHKNVLNWGGIGYNVYIHKNGAIYKGRWLDQGAGVYDHNTHTIHICFQGRYHTADKSMPDSQFNAGIWAIKELKKRFPKARVVGHKYFGGTACPGQYFPLQEMIEGKYRQGVEDDVPMTNEERALLNNLAGTVEGAIEEIHVLEQQVKNLSPHECPPYAKDAYDKLQRLGVKFSDPKKTPDVWQMLKVMNEVGLLDKKGV